MAVQRGLLADTRIRPIGSPQAVRRRQPVQQAPTKSPAQTAAELKQIKKGTESGIALFNVPASPVAGAEQVAGNVGSLGAEQLAIQQGGFQGGAAGASEVGSLGNQLTQLSQSGFGVGETGAGLNAGAEAVAISEGAGTGAAAAEAAAASEAAAAATGASTAATGASTAGSNALTSALAGMGPWGWAALGVGALVAGKELDLF